MKALKPLVHQLQRTLHVVLLRRCIAWASCALIFLVLGAALSRFQLHGRVFQLGLQMTALSLLPAFLFWPPSGRHLQQQLRGLDEEMVFEAYLEAEPGPVRDLLRKLAGEKAAALPFAERPREPLLTGLRGLLSVALTCVLLGRPLRS